MGKKSSKSKTKTEPWKPMQPYILGAAGTMNNVVNANQPKLEQLAGDVRSLIPGLKGMITADQAHLAPAFSYASDVLGGKYLNEGNPYMQGMIHDAEQAAGNAVNSTFSAAGRTGGGANQQALARGVASANNQLRYADYDAERQRMSQMGALMPSLTAAQYAGYAPYLEAAQTAGQLPYAGVGALNGLLGMGAGAGTTTSKQPGGLMGGLLGAASNMFSFAPISLSDRRLKSNIVKVGELADGLGVYEYDILGERQRGVMADEVKELRPEAYVPNLAGGFDGVNYALIGDLA